jgi:prepilin-type N-terminal cleavage/methylation domain-containing protein
MGGFRTALLEHDGCPARPAWRRARGFTLLEVAVAMAVLGLVLGTMMQVLSGGLNLEYKAGRLARAVLRARALADELLSQIELRDGVEENVDPDGLRWRRAVRAATPEEMGIEPGGEEESDFADERDFALKSIEVSVAWDESSGEKTYTVRSLRVTPALE